ncbi:MAG: hypothetical protein ABR570_06015 [Burkholderiales bacterium]
MTRDEPALTAQPAWLWLALAGALAAQVSWRALEPKASLRDADLPPAPPVSVLRLAALGEPEVAARLTMLHLQAFDYGATNSAPYRTLDYRRLAQWLHNILELDPRSQYPLFAAARIYAETADQERCRRMLEFIYQEFFADPDRRWPWLAHAALLAKHRLKDLPLAERYAAAVERYTRGKDVPLWARQMHIFILEDMNELEAARIMLGGLLASGAIRDPAEARFLAQRLKSLEERLHHGR